MVLLLEYVFFQYSFHPCWSEVPGVPVAGTFPDTMFFVLYLLLWVYGIRNQAFTGTGPDTRC